MAGAGDGAVLGPLPRQPSTLLAEGYLELLQLTRKAASGLKLSAAVPWYWDREGLEIESNGSKKRFIEHVLDRLDVASIMAYRGRNVAKVIEAIEHECGYKPGRVELILETDRKVVEEGVPLHVGDRTRMEMIFAAARERFGPSLREAVHHYTTYRRLPK